MPTEADLPTAIDEVADETRFSGVVRVDAAGETVVAKAFGHADRAHGIANTVETQFGIASGTKGFTALTVVSLIAEGRLELETPARRIVGDDLPLIDEGVTIEHLLAHRSGIGDYLDEEAGTDITDYLLPVPVHQLASTPDYLAVLDGHPAKFPPGERFSYCNSGYVVLALIAERITGTPFPVLVQERVAGPAGMTATAFLRSDELPGGAAIGYLHPDGLRTNVLHLPVAGSGDGGLYSTAADVHALWAAFAAGRIVPERWVAAMVQPRSDVPAEDRRYGLGFWLHRTEPAVLLEGFDAGVSFRSVHDPVRGTTWTVLSNSTMGAWPAARRLEALLLPGR